MGKLRKSSKKKDKDNRVKQQCNYSEEAIIVQYIPISEALLGISHKEHEFYTYVFSLWYSMMTHYGRIDYDLVGPMIKQNGEKVITDVTKKELYDYSIRLFKRINVMYCEYKTNLYTDMPHKLCKFLTDEISKTQRNTCEVVHLKIVQLFMANFLYRFRIKVRYLYVDLKIHLGDKYVIQGLIIPEFYMHFEDTGSNVFMRYYNKYCYCELATEEEFNDFYNMLHEIITKWNIKFDHSTDCTLSRHKHNNSFESLQYIYSIDKEEHCDCDIAKYKELFRFVSEIESMLYEYDELEGLPKRKFDDSYLAYKHKINDDTLVYDGKEWNTFNSIYDLISKLAMLDIAEMYKK